MGDVLSEREATFKRLHSQGLLGVTFDPLHSTRVCVNSASVCVFLVPLLAAWRLQPAGPCGTHLTGEQRRLNAFTAHERGGRPRALARPGKQAGRETGGGRRRRKQTEKAEQLTRHRKKTD